MKSIVWIFPYIYIQKVSVEKKTTASIPAMSHANILFLLRSFGVQNARKSEIIHIMDRTNITDPKVPLMSCFSRIATSFGLMFRFFMRKTASSGLKTIYAPILPRNTIATKNIDTTSFRKVPREIGSCGFFGAGVLFQFSVSGDIGEILVCSHQRVLLFVISCFCSCDARISARRDSVFSSGIHSESVGARSVIEKKLIVDSIQRMALPVKKIL